LTRTLARIAITGSLIAALVYWLDMGALLKSAQRMQAGHLAVGILLCFAFVAARIFKWILILRINGLSAPLVAIVRSMLFALAVGIVTPVRIGEVVAVAPFPPSETRSRSLTVYLFDRVGELSTVFLFSAPACYLLLPGLGKPLAVGLVILSLAMPLILQISFWRLCIARRFEGKVSNRLTAFLSSDIKASPAYWLWSCFTYLLTYASIAVFIHGFEPISQLSSLMVLPVVTISNLVTITIGGLGVREGLAALLSPSVGLTPEFVAVAFFLSFVFTRALPGMFGLIWFAISTKRGESSAGSRAA
jgi:uncharacterized membrane protein YbhN (UPF0104 family)